jgi:transcriptional regulator with XRE-family HTH domain
MARGWTKYRGERAYELEEFATTCARVRAALGWSGSYLAEQAEISRATLWHAERAERPLPPEQRKKLAEALGAAAEAAGLIARRELLVLAGLSTRGAVSGFSGEIAPAKPAPGPSPSFLKLWQDLEAREAEYAWHETVAKGLRARTYFPPGSTEWALITAHWCALMSEQAGEADRALHYLHEIDDQYREQGKEPEPTVVAQRTIDEGTVRSEQTGELDQALALFRRSARAADEAGETLGEIGASARYFQRLVLARQVMTASGSWLTAVPARHLDPRLAQQVATTFDESPAYWRAIPEVTHAWERVSRFMALGCLSPGAALKELQPAPLFREHRLERVVALHRARWAAGTASDPADWRGVASLARDARDGYRRTHSTPGAAHSAAIEALAIGRSQSILRSARAARRALDLWILALLLHPYDTHPLWKEVLSHLVAVTRALAREHPRWLHAYFADLDLRITARDAEFATLDDMAISPTSPAAPYVKLLLPPEVRDRT